MIEALPWQVVTVDLAGGVPALVASPGHGRLFVSLWWGSVPVGHLDVTAGELPWTARQLALAAAPVIAPAVGGRLGLDGFAAPLPQVAPDLRAPTPQLADLLAEVRPLAALGERAGTTPPAGASPLSVVICTRDRPDALQRCLDSLAALQQAPHEILVVDNAPSDERTAQLVDERPGVRYVREPRPGLDVARNTGLRHATGEIAAYVDDDVRVHPGWTAAVEHAFREADVAAVAGLVLPAELGTAAQAIFEKSFGGFGRGYRPRRFDTAWFARVRSRGAPVWEIGAGANLAVRRGAALAAGGFDERLDAGAAGCNGDSEFLYRLLAAGGVCVYEPNAVVYHYHRDSLPALRRQMYFYMRGHVAALLIQWETHGDWGNLRHLFLNVSSYYAGLLLQGLGRGFPVEIRLLLVGVPGSVAGVGFYLRDVIRRFARRLWR